MPHLVTTLGERTADQLGMILPHEHIFVDLGPIEEANWRRARAEDVLRLMVPEIEAIQAQGITALVESTPVGVGRRADIDRAVSEATGLPVLVPTGIYREPWIPPWAMAAAEDEIAAWMLGELNGTIEESGVQAAWIKISAGDEAVSPAEAKLVRAAGVAGIETNAVIGSHTIRGRVVREQLALLEEVGYRPERFIWIHTQNEPDFSLHLEMADRGCWLEYDGIGGGQSDDSYIERILALLERGYGDQLLLSHDRGWYDPSKPGGGTPRPFTYLVETFLPKLTAAGVDQETIRQLTCDNPFRAYAR